jgi:hypothetical protein
MRKKSKILSSSNELFGTELIFEEFHNYLNLMEDFLSKNIKDFEEKLDKNKKNIERESRKVGEFKNDYQNHFEGMLFEQYHNIFILYPHYFRTSFLIHLISFIEFELREICYDFHYRHSTDFSINDLKGNSDFDKAKKFLTRTVNINFNQLNPEWNFINTVRKIRNKLVHHQGIICENDNDFNEIELFVDNYDFISFDTNLFNNSSKNLKCHNLIIKKKDMNKFLLRNAEKFFIKLLERLS